FEFKGSLLFPVTGRVVKDFGLFEDEEFHYRLAHKGLLFQVKPKTKVRSIHEGKVAFAAEISGHGRTLVVDHGDHYYSVYAMTDSLLVKIGDHGKVGQALAESSDYTYFEIRHFSDAIDPKPWMRGEGASS